MGISASSLLDETKSNYIKGQAEAELKDFSPYYRKQFSVARLSQVEDDLEQHKEKITQLLQQREALEAGEVLYEEGVLYFDDSRKWRERYVVVRANYCLECHDSLETFVKGVPPRQKLLPTGGAVLTTEEAYMAMVDKCFPDDTNVKEDFAPPLSGMPGQFPVYLRLPYRRDSYFCFRQQAKQAAFLSILSDCIRHQNQDFLKKKTCEVQAFLKAIQLYRQDKGKYQAWDMLIGSDIRVMANVVMEQLLPSLEKDMLPRLKAKKTEKKRVWFATVEAAYILVQEHLLEGLSALKEECRTSVRQQEVLIHSDMDQILESRRQLEEKVRAKVSEPAEKLCSESVQPYLGSVLEELMEPVSSGFQEGRQLSETMMDRICQDVLLQDDNEQLKKALADMLRPSLLSCYQRIGSLQEKLQHLQDRFGFSNITGVIHSAQIDLQQLMMNAAYTFEQLLYKAVKDNPDNASSAIEKAKHRVLKQYDYDSSTVRKRISREALVSITLPFIKKSLAPTCKTELQDLEQSVYANHSNFIHVQNVYESILLQSLDKEVTKVVKEAASLKKYNLFTDSRDLLSQSSRSSLSSPPVSTPSSPAMTLASPSKSSSPASPLAVNGLPSTPEKEQEEEKVDGVLQSEASSNAAAIETPLVEQKEAAQSVAVSQEAALALPPPEAEDPIQAVKEEAVAPVALETPTVAAPAERSEMQEVNEAAAPETVIQEEVETSAEPQTPSADAQTEAESIKTDMEAAAAQTKAPAPSPDPANEPEPPAPSPDPANEPEPPAPSPDPANEPEAPAPSPDPANEPEAPAPSPDPANEPEPPAPSPDPANEPEPPAPSPDPTNEPEPPAPSCGSTREPEVPAQSPGSANEAVITSAEGAQGQTAAGSEEKSDCGNSEVELEAPSAGQTLELTPADDGLDLKQEQTEPVTVSDPNSVDVSVGSESAPSDMESVDEVKETQSSEDEVSTTSDVLEDEANLSKSPESSDEPAEDQTTSDKPPSPQAQTDAVSGDIEASGDVEAGGDVEVSWDEQSVEAAEATPAQSSEPAKEETRPSPEEPPLDSIKEIRDLVVEVFEVEELVQRYPSGVPKEE